MGFIPSDDDEFDANAAAEKFFGGSTSVPKDQSKITIHRPAVEDDKTFRDFFAKQGFKVNRTFGRAINKNSPHTYGGAADISIHGKSPEDLYNLMESSLLKGYRVFDERQPAPGVKQTGPHVHVENAKTTLRKPSRFVNQGFSPEQIQKLQQLDNQRRKGGQPTAFDPVAAADGFFTDFDADAAAEQYLNAPSPGEPLAQDPLASQIAQDVVAQRVPGTVAVPPPVQDDTPQKRYEQWLIDTNTPDSQDAVDEFRRRLTNEFEQSKRIRELEDVSEAAKEGKNYTEVAKRQAEIQKRFDTEKAANPALTVEAFNQTLQAENTAANEKSKADWLKKNPELEKFAKERKIDPFADDTIEAYKETVRQENVRRQKTAQIQKQITPTSKGSTGYNFQKTGKLVLPATPNVQSSQELTYSKDPELEKKGEYRFTDAEGDTYIFNPKAGQIVDEADATVIKEVELPLPEQGTQATAVTKRAWAELIADEVANYADIPREDVADYFAHYGFTDLKTDQPLDAERFFRGSFVNPVTGLAEDAQTDKYQLTQREVNRMLAFSKDRAETKAVYEKAKGEYATAGDDEFVSDVKARKDAGWMTEKNADDELSVYQQKRKELQNYYEDWGVREFGDLDEKQAARLTKDALAELKKKYGSFRAIGDEDKRIAALPISERIVEAGRSLVATIPKAIGAVFKTAGSIGYGLGEIGVLPGKTGGTIQETPLFQIGEAYDWVGDWGKNEVAHRAWESKAADVIGQVAIAAGSAWATGGISLPATLGLSQGFASQVDEAAKEGATPNQQLGRGVVGAVAAMPDILLMKGWFKAFTGPARVGLVKKLGQSVFSQLVIKGATASEASLIAKAAQTAFVQRAGQLGQKILFNAEKEVFTPLTKAGIVGKGFKGTGLESVQEWQENDVNLIGKKFISNPEITWEDIVKISDEDVESIKYGGIGGLFGAKIEIATHPDAFKSFKDRKAAFAAINESLSDTNLVRNGDKSFTLGGKEFEITDEIADVIQAYEGTQRDIEKNSKALLDVTKKAKKAKSFGERREVVAEAKALRAENVKLIEERGRIAAELINEADAGDALITAVKDAPDSAAVIEEAQKSGEPEKGDIATPVKTVVTPIVKTEETDDETPKVEVTAKTVKEAPIVAKPNVVEKVKTIDTKAETRFAEPVTRLREAIANVPADHKGHGALKQAAETLEESDDPISALNQVQRIRTRTDQMKPSQGRNGARAVADEIASNLKEEGYEVEDLIGKPFDVGMNVEATFVEDSSVPFGEERITEIKRPQIMKDGKMVQHAVVLVGKNYDESSETPSAREARLEKERVKEEKRQKLKQDLRADIVAKPLKKIERRGDKEYDGIEFDDEPPSRFREPVRKMASELFGEDVSKNDTNLNTSQERVKKTPETFTDEESKDGDKYAPVRATDQKDFIRKTDFLKGYLDLDKQLREFSDKSMGIETSNPKYAETEKELDRLDRDIALQVDQGAKYFGITPDDFITLVNEYETDKGAIKKALLPTQPTDEKEERVDGGDISDIPNFSQMPDSYVQARKQPDGSFRLTFVGTDNDVFVGEKFKSATEARQYFKAQKIKAQAPPTDEKAKDVAVKEPWEMSQAEYTEQYRKPDKDQSFDAKAAPVEFIEGVRRRLGETALEDGKVKASSILKYYDSFDGSTPKAERYAKVAYALSQGKSVPAEVVADYPDLKEKALGKDAKDTSGKEPHDAFVMSPEDINEGIASTPVTKKGNTFLVKDLWPGKTYDSRESADVAVRDYWSNRRKIDLKNWETQLDLDSGDVFSKVDILRKLARNKTSAEELEKVWKYSQKLTYDGEPYTDASLLWDIAVNPNVSPKIRALAKMARRKHQLSTARPNELALRARAQAAEQASNIDTSAKSAATTERKTLLNLGYTLPRQKTLSDADKAAIIEGKVTAKDFARNKAVAAKSEKAGKIEARNATRLPQESDADFDLRQAEADWRKGQSDFIKEKAGGKNWYVAQRPVERYGDDFRFTKKEYADAEAEYAATNPRPVAKLDNANTALRSTPETFDIIDSKGNIDYERAKNVAGRVERGELEIRRLSPEVERGRIAGGKRNVEASIILAGDAAASEASGSSRGSGMDSVADTARRQEGILENYAKRNDIWFKQGHFPDRLFIDKGGEANVYRKDENRVVKLVDPRHIDKSMTPQKFIDHRIALFNYLFPDSHYELMGFMRDNNGKFRFVVTQQYIQNEPIKRQADVDAFMQSKGLDRTGRQSYSNDLYEVHDLHEKNVVKNKNGTIYVIDAVPKAKHVLPFSVVEKDTALRSTPSLDAIPEVRNDKGQAFYSRVESVIADKLPPKATPAQVTALLAKNSVKELDPEFIALKLWLDDQGQSVSKADVLAFVEANKVNVQEVVKGVPRDHPRMFMQPTDDLDVDDLRFDRESYFDYDDKQEAVTHRWDDDGKVGGTVIRDLNDIFYAFDTDGREIMSPAGTGFDTQQAAEDAISENSANEYGTDSTQFAQWQLPGESENYREEFLTAPNDADAKAKSTAYVREVLGEYAWNKMPEAERQSLIADEIVPEWQDGHADYSDIKNPIARIRYNDRTTTDGDKMLFGEEFQQPSKENFAKMPKVYQKYGEQMAIRKMLYRAVEGGYDYFGFTTGQQQADRYDLSKHVKQIRTKAWSGGNRKVEIVPIKGDDIEIEVTPDGKVVEGYKEFIGKNLDEVVGKDLAPQILEAPTDGYKVFSGLDLKVGGEGLINRYDRKHVDYINKLMKPYGVSVEAKDIETLDQKEIDLDDYQAVELDDGKWGIDHFGEDLEIEFDSEQEAQDYIRKGIGDYQTETIHAVRISPEFRKAVEASMRDNGGAFALFKLRNADDLADLENLKKADFRSIVPKIASSVVSDAKGANILSLDTNESGEVARTLYAITHDAARKDVPVLDGMFMTPSQVQDFREAAVELADLTKEKGVDDKPIRDLIKNIDKAAKGDGTIRLEVFENSRGHETIHQSSYIGAVDKALDNRYADGIEDVPAFAKFHEALNRIQGDSPLSVAREEALAYLSDGDYARFGLTENEAVEVVAKLVELYAEKNGVDALKSFEGTKAYEHVEKFYESQSRDRGNASRSESSSERETEPETTEGQPESRDTEERGEAFTPGGKVKESQTPKSMQANDIPMSSRTYVSTTNSERQEFADKQLDKGLDVATKWLKDQMADGNLNAGATGVVGINVMSAMAKRGQIKELNEIGNNLVPMITDAAQAVQAMSIMSLYSPETAAAYVKKIVKQRTGKDVTQAEVDKAIDLAQRLSDEAADTALHDAEMARLLEEADSLRREMAEYKADNEELESKNKTLKVDLTKAKATITRQKNKLAGIEKQGGGRRTSADVKKLLTDITERQAEIDAAIRAEFGDSALMMVAWHGSPHTFDKFDISKIGTGEGAQAYGHGLYFTDQESIAQHYKNALEKRTPVVLKINGIELNQDNSLSEYSDALNDDAGDQYDTMYFRAIIEAIEDENLDTLKILDRNLYAHVQDILRNNDIEVIKPRGAKYRVDLKPAADEYLLWDKPLSEQSEKVKKGVKDWLDDYYGTGVLQGADDIFPKEYDQLGDLYNDVAGLVGEPKQVSDDMRAFGIRGIKYLDGTSRGKGEGSYNYVIFDDADVSIEEILRSTPERPLSKALIDAATKRLYSDLNAVDAKGKPAPKRPQTFIDEMNVLTNGKLSPEQLRELHATAMVRLTPKGTNISDDVKSANRIRRQHAKMVQNYLNGQYQLPKDQRTPRAASAIINTGIEAGYTDEDIFYALARRKHINPKDALNALQDEFADLKLPDLKADSKAKKQYAEIQSKHREIIKNSSELIGLVKSLNDAKRITAKYEITNNQADVASIKESERFDRDRKRRLNKEAARFYSAVTKSTYEVALDTIVNLRRANLLTGLKTHGRNLIGNVVFNAGEEVLRIPAGAIDTAAGLVTGERTTGLSATAIGKGFNALVKADPTMVSAGRERGMTQAMDFLRYGGSYEDNVRLQHEESILGEKFPKMKWMDNYINFVYKTLGAEDALFKVYAFRRSLQEEARMLAITDRKTDKSVNVKERTRELLKKPTPLMIQVADDYANIMTFQNSNKLSDWLNKVKRTSPTGKAIIETVVPYDRTPTNIVLRTLEYSPLGVGIAAKKAYNIRKTNKGREVPREFRDRYTQPARDTAKQTVDWNTLTDPEKRKAIDDLIRRTYTRDQQAQFSRTMARGGAGTALFGLGVALAMAGLLAGSMSPDDDDKKEKDEFFARRKRGVENRSLRIPGVGRFVLPKAPPFDVMVAGATMYEQSRMAKGNELLGYWNGAAESMKDIIMEQPLLNSASNLYNTAKKGKVGAFTGSLLGGYIPTLVSDVGEVIDPKARTTSGYMKGDKNWFNEQGRGFRNSFTRRIPILRQFTADESDAIPDEIRGDFLRRLPRLIDLFETRPDTEYEAPRGRKDADGTDAFLASPEFKQMSTDDIVYYLKYDADPNDRQKVVDALTKKAQNAQKGGTLTQTEVDNIKKEVPDFAITARDTKGKASEVSDPSSAVQKIKEIGSVSEALKNPSVIRWSTDDWVAVMQSDLSDADKKLAADALKKKAENARRSKTLTQDEVNRINSVLPDFKIKADDRKGASTAKKLADLAYAKNNGRDSYEGNSPTPTANLDSPTKWQGQRSSRNIIDKRDGSPLGTFINNINGDLDTIREAKFSGGTPAERQEARKLLQEQIAESKYIIKTKSADPVRARTVLKALLDVRSRVR